MLNKGYPHEFIDRVRNASNIVEIAKTYLPLKQKGQSFWACCPFHQEKTPSFVVNGLDQFYYCYGCHTSGNVFTLVMKMENLSWHEALEFLAKKAHLELPQTADNAAWLKAKRQKEQIYQALMLARDFYCQNLYQPKNRPALEYLYQRGLNDEDIKLFHLGYSDEWGGVIEALKQHGISERIMREAGIVSFNEKNHIWDAQFERIIFSIHDVYGNCIGFTGRTMKNEPNIAKYKNTAETIVFNKSNIVYGIDVMKEKTRNQKIDGLIVVEGNVDEIAMIKNGFVNTVACMGTALTKFHANIMSRFGKVVYLCLDGDSAGENAALKSIDVLQVAGLTVKIVTLPNQQDPDEYLRSAGREAMQQRLEQSMSGLEFKLYYVKKHSDLSDRAGKTAYLNRAVAILAQIESPAERELYLEEVANTVAVGVDVIRQTVNAKVAQKTPISNGNTISSVKQSNNNHKILQPKVTNAETKAEQIVVSAVLHNRPYAQYQLDELPPFSNSVYQKIMAEGLKLNNINDKLEPEELAVIQPLLAATTELSAQEQVDEWQACLNRLRIKQLELQRAQAPTMAEKVQITQRMQAIKQKQKAEE